LHGYFAAGHDLKPLYECLSAIRECYAVQISLFALTAARFVENSGPANPIKLLPKQVNSLRSAAKVFQLERCQWRRLSEHLDLEVDEFADFSFDVGFHGNLLRH
jgi:hypothetical protein